MRCVHLLLLWPLSITAPGWVNAEESGSTPLSEVTPAEGEETVSQEDQARIHFEEGVERAASAEWGPALRAFEASLDSLATPVAAFNRCLCLRRLERVPEATGCYTAFLERFGAQASEADRTEASQELQRLRPMVGSVSVQVDQPEGASVSLDGATVGRIPLDGPLFVSPGRHAVEIRQDGFVPARREIDVEAGAELTFVTTLEPARAGVGTIMLEASHPGVTVALDGREVGTTPLLDQIIFASAGQHVVEGRRPGYETERVEVRVTAEQVSRASLDMTPLAEIPPEHAGRLEVSISERESTVLLDGRPLAAGPVPIGPHLLEVRREGFLPWSEEVDVVAGTDTQVDVTLRPTQTFVENYRSRARRFRLGAYLTMGVGAAALGTALGLLVWNRGRRDDWEAENLVLEDYVGPDRPSRVSDNEELGRSVDTVAGVNWAVMATGCLAAIASVVLFVTGPSPGRYGELAVTPMRGGLSTTISWQFD